jgi:hypothetical protein
LTRSRMIPRSNSANAPSISNNRLARGRRSIEPLLLEEQTYSLFMKALEYAEQIGERSTEAVH